MDVKKVKNKNKHSFLKKVWFALIFINNSCIHNAKRVVEQCLSYER